MIYPSQMLTCLITGINTDHLVKMVSATFDLCEAVLSPFVINKYLMKRYFRRGSSIIDEEYEIQKSCDLSKITRL